MHWQSLHRWLCALGDWVASARTHHPHRWGWGTMLGAVSIDVSLHGIATALSIVGVLAGIAFHAAGAVSSWLSGAQSRRLERERADRERERHDAEMERIRPARVNASPGVERLN